MPHTSRLLLLTMFLTAGLLTACRSSPPTVPAPASSATLSPATLTPSPAPITRIPPTSTPSPSSSPAPTALPTATGRPTATPTPTEAPFDWLSYTPAIIAGLPVDCPTPKSLMLHIAYGSARMEELAQAIIANNLKTITYQDVIEGLIAGKCPEKDTIIVSLDDLGTSWLLPEFANMVDVFIEHELKMVVGVVVKGPQASFVWDYLREVHAAGVEIASHSVNHYNLNELNVELLEEEIQFSFAVICEHLGTCPVSFILPFGAYDQRVFVTSEEYTFVVGIGGGFFFGGELPFYIGRQGPYVYDQQETLNRLVLVYDVNFPETNQSQIEPHPTRRFQPDDSLEDNPG